MREFLHIENGFSSSGALGIQELSGEENWEYLEPINASTFKFNLISISIPMQILFVFLFQFQL